jgi:pimeloyl-ACP methyl ester carboxylesterase
MDVAANGGIISYRRAGTGPPTVLLHGAEADSAMFGRVAALLSSNYTVLMPDQRDSGGTKFADAPYTIADLADDTAAFITGLGITRAHILGTSFGGFIAQELALRHPDRVGRLVLSATALSPAGISAEFTAASRAAANDESAAAARVASLFFAPGATERRPGLTSDLAAVRVQRPGRSQARRLAAATGFDTTGRLARLAAPTLVLAGGGDQIVDASQAFTLWRAIPDATLAIVAGIGHAWALEAPERGASIVSSFLEGEL